MKKISILLLLLCLSVDMVAQTVGYRVRHADRIEGKNYYFTSLIKESTGAQALIRSNSVLQTLSADKYKMLVKASNTYSRIEALQFSDNEIERAGRELARLYRKGNVLDSLLQNDILPSGCYLQYHDSGAKLIERIWQQDARGMNRAIRIYAAGEKPNYPNIDSIGFDVNSKYYQQEILPTIIQNVMVSIGSNPIFFDIPLHAVSTLLDINDRCQALDFEPLCQQDNAEPYRHISQTDWQAYPYTAILVLGAGPEDPCLAISPEGRMRASYAAMLWQQHKAPFIIVSGGRVHPYHTPYNEAREMKAYIMEKWHIPAYAIIMEPHARHTTTNIRNTARIMLREGFPMGRKVLITSSESHISYVVNPRFIERCQQEMGVVPFRLVKRVSPREAEFYPQASATIINPDEPLDP